MAKDLVGQFKSVWSASRILTVGESRYEQKQSAREELAVLAQGATSARLAERTSITSYRTYDLYKGVSADFARFAESLGVHRVADLRPAHAEAYLRAKMASGASCNTLRTASAALGKLDAAIARCPRKMHVPEARLRPGVDAVRGEINATAPRLDTGRRAYVDPVNLVEALRDHAHQIVARLQLEAGFRISEVQGLGRCDLRGVVSDPVTGGLAGLVHVQGKGGFERVQYVPIDTYRALAERLKNEAGALNFGYGAYLRSLRSACKEAGELYSGSHALRHSYIQGFVLSAAESGKLDAHAIQREAMERVGHHRESELKTYFR